MINVYFRLQTWIGIIVLAIALLTIPPAWAENWQLVATSANGQEQQYIAPDSIQSVSSPPGAIAQVKTYWVNQTTQQITTAITQYQCDRQQYRDIELNGQSNDPSWQSIIADPLNQAVMDYTCSRVADEALN